MNPAGLTTRPAGVAGSRWARVPFRWWSYTRIMGHYVFFSGVFELLRGTRRTRSPGSRSGRWSRCFPGLAPSRRPGRLGRLARPAFRGRAAGRCGGRRPLTTVAPESRAAVTAEVSGLVAAGVRRGDFSAGSRAGSHHARPTGSLGRTKAQEGVAIRARAVLARTWRSAPCRAEWRAAGGAGPGYVFRLTLQPKGGRAAEDGVRTRGRAEPSLGRVLGRQRGSPSTDQAARRSQRRPRGRRPGAATTPGTVSTDQRDLPNGPAQGDMGRQRSEGHKAGVRGDKAAKKSRAQRPGLVTKSLAPAASSLPPSNEDEGRTGGPGRWARQRGPRVRLRGVGTADKRRTGGGENEAAVSRRRAGPRPRSKPVGGSHLAQGDGDPGRLTRSTRRRSAAAGLPARFRGSRTRRRPRGRRPLAGLARPR